MPHWWLGLHVLPTRILTLAHHTSGTGGGGGGSAGEVPIQYYVLYYVLYYCTGHLPDTRVSLGTGDQCALVQDLQEVHISDLHKSESCLIHVLSIHHHAQCSSAPCVSLNTIHGSAYSPYIPMSHDCSHGHGYATMLH